MIFDVDELERRKAEGLLRTKKHPYEPLWIWNYTEQCQIHKQWDEYTLAARGLILEEDGTVLARGFPKFFNHGDPLVGEIDWHQDHIVTEKVDGSLGIAFEWNGEIGIATRGSFESEQSKEALRILEGNGYTLGWDSGYTPLFEIIYPSNRIVVDYAGRRELVLLGIVDNHTGWDAETRHVTWDGPTVPTHVLRLEGTDGLDALKARERPNSEGYVVAFADSKRVKIKHDAYVRLHRIVTGINRKAVWEVLREGGDPLAELEGIPDEIYSWVQKTTTELLAEYLKVLNLCDEVFQTRPRYDDVALHEGEVSDREYRKVVAEHFTSSGAHTGVLFKMLDDRPFEDLIWGAIKPESERPAEVAATTE